MSETPKGAAPTAQTEKLYIHLTGAGRYHVHGVLYKSGVAYPVPDRETMYKFLGHMCEGKRMFDQYVPKPKKVVQSIIGDDTPVEQLPTVESDVPPADPLSNVAKVTPNAIVVGEPGEENEGTVEAAGEEIVES